MAGRVHTLRQLRFWRQINRLAMFLGENLLAWLIIALGGAMFAGNAAALIRPPKKRRDENDLVKAPVLRSVIMATVGAIAAIWSAVSLF